MPDLSQCKSIDGNLYCWDRETKRYVIVHIKPVSTFEDLQKVVAAFADDKNIGGKDE